MRASLPFHHCSPYASQEFCLAFLASSPPGPELARHAKSCWAGTRLKGRVGGVSQGNSELQIPLIHCSLHLSLSPTLASRLLPKSTDASCATAAKRSTMASIAMSAEQRSSSNSGSSTADSPQAQQTRIVHAHHGRSARLTLCLAKHVYRSLDILTGTPATTAAAPTAA